MNVASKYGMVMPGDPADGLECTERYFCTREISAQQVEDAIRTGSAPASASAPHR